MSHINTDITVDGVLDEPHWQNATLVPIAFQDEPTRRVYHLLKPTPAMY
ncbi:hypothetical protein ACOBV9_20620 (plasmid) [Pseudoalteromonas espejiana]